MSLPSGLPSGHSKGRPKFEMADVVRQFLPQMEADKILNYQQYVLEKIQDCRTAAMGGHLDACNECGHIQISYNSCRNRHCPKCQGIRKEMWIVQQEDMLLPVSYFHVVFTLPHELNQLCLWQPKFMYDLLFSSAWHTLNTLALDPKWLGAKTAATMVLHTWSQTLVLHPHLHCIVPNGGLTKDGKWQFPKRSKGKENFLFPVQAMKKIFKGHFMAGLKAALENGLLRLPPDFPMGRNYKKWKDILYQKQWVVYTKKPFSSVKKVVSYLGRYAYRIALTNHRIKNIGKDHVTFQYKDYKDGAKKKLMTLQGTEFLRRFCLHIIPPKFRKTRQYGFLANATKAKSLNTARIALATKVKKLLSRKERKTMAIQRIFSTSVNQCPCCKKGEMGIIDQWKRNKSPPKWIECIMI